MHGFVEVPDKVNLGGWVHRYDVVTLYECLSFLLKELGQILSCSRWWFTSMHSFYFLEYEENVNLLIPPLNKL